MLTRSILPFHLFTLLQRSNLAPDPKPSTLDSQRVFTIDQLPESDLQILELLRCALVAAEATPAAALSRIALPVDVVMICMKPPSAAETPFRTSAHPPSSRKGTATARLTKYGMMRFGGWEKLYTFAAVERVALALVFHRA